MTKIKFSSPLAMRLCSFLAINRIGMATYVRHALGWRMEPTWGGFGSGRYGFSSATCESAHSIDLAWLRGRGMLKPGNRATLTWSMGGQKTGSVGVLVQADGLRLMYAVTVGDGTKISVDELVPFVHTATQFGGRRQWLRYAKCGRGCRKLYGGCYFRCRQCHGLKYASQRENSAQRAMHRADRIANRLHDMWCCYA